MAEIDSFASRLFEEAKAFLEKSRSQQEAQKGPYLRAAILLAFCSLEAHVNAIADDFLTLERISPLERSILSEKRIELNDGRFETTEKLQMYRLEDRLLFICHNYSKAKMNKQSTEWGDFKAALTLRNELSHPRVPPQIDEPSVERALQSILGILNLVYKSVYKKKYPGFARGLDSILTV
jgi:hypothetical protein